MRGEVFPLGLSTINRICILAMALMLAFSQVGSGQSSDETALRGLVEKFFAAYQSRDLEGLMKLWSDKSPDFESSRREIQRTFETNEQIGVKDLSVRKITVEPQNSRVRVTLEMTAIETKTAKPSAVVGKINRIFKCVREEGMWKVWKYEPAEDELAASLVAAKTENQRRSLMEGDKELVTPRLCEALVAQGRAAASKEASLAIYELALDLAEQLQDKKGEATTLLAIGRVYASLRNHSKAMQYYRRSLGVAEGIGSKEIIASSMARISALLGNQGNYTEALRYSEKSLELCREIGNQFETLRLMNNMAQDYDALGFTEKAEAMARESLDRARALDETVDEQFRKGETFRALTNMGNFAASRGDHADAMQFYQQSLRLAEAWGEETALTISLNNVAAIQVSQGNYRQAHECLTKALTAARASGDKKWICTSLITTGSAYQSEGKTAKALEFLEPGLKMAFEIDEEGDILGLITIGDAYAAQGNLARALESYEKARIVTERDGDKMETARILESIANLRQREGRFSDSLALAGRAAELAKQIGNTALLSNAHAIAGKAYRSLNQPDLAYQAFAESIAGVETMRALVAGGEQERQGFLERNVSPYYEMVDLLIGQNRLPEALATAERAKGRTLLDVLERGRVNINRAMTREEQEQERKLKGELVSLNSQFNLEKQQEKPDTARLSNLTDGLEKARLEYESYQGNLYVAHPDLRVQRGDAQPFTSNELPMISTELNTAWLEFVVTEKKTFLFVLTEESAVASQKSERSAARRSPVINLRVYSLVIGEKDLADRIGSFRQLVTARRSGFQQLATQLYDLLLKPARLPLQNLSNLVIVPDGPLWDLPFQVLKPSIGRYLLQDCAISYVPSLTVLREVRKHRGPDAATIGSRTLLAVGNPAVGGETTARVGAVFMDEKLAPLPEAEKQVARLRALYGLRETTAYIGAEAREERVKQEAGRYRILHLATHGILNDASPMYSHLVLSQTRTDGTEDGLLEAWEIMKLDLKAELAVLSACDTARGRFGAGEGVIGLSWAFFVAGCPTTVVSQWKVASTSTTELMIEFHRRLVAGERKTTAPFSKAQALRLASLKLLRSKRYRHPFYWAPFVLVGADS